MSRIGRKPIVVPSGVDVNIEGSKITVKGPKGSLTNTFHADITFTQENNEIQVNRPSDHRTHRALHGTTRSILSNMVEGVSTGFTRQLDLMGVGYRASKKGNNVVLNVGYSHPVEMAPEEGIEIDVPSQTQIIVKGIDKQRVGAMAAKIRSVREPEPYKGKGIRYSDEVIRRKEGKTGK